jgi:hypothetical protein
MKRTLQDVILKNETVELLYLESYTKEELNEYFNEGNDFPLSYAIQAGNASYFLFNDEILSLLDLNLTNKNGRTALMLAAGRGLDREVKVMLRNGADWTMKDYDGKTALDYAKKYEKYADEYESTEEDKYESEEDEEFWSRPPSDIVSILENPELYKKK